MVYLPNIRRRYFTEREPVVPPPGPGVAAWPDFDLAKTGAAVAYASLRDSAAGYSASNNIDLYNLQTLPDDRLCFGAQYQGHGYIWGFDDGHAFEVEHFKATCDSKAPVVGGMGSAVVYGSGRFYLYGYYTGSGMVDSTLTTPNNLATKLAGSIVNIPMSSGYAIRLAMATDGTAMFNKNKTGSTLYCRHLLTPYSPNHFLESQVTSVNLNTARGSNRAEWRAVHFSPDGLVLLATSGGSNTGGMVHKFRMSTAWDITTATLASEIELVPSGVSAFFEGVAVNNAGTKMIIFSRADAEGTTANNAEFKFFEYNLVV